MILPSHLKQKIFFSNRRNAATNIKLFVVTLFGRNGRPILAPVHSGDGIQSKKKEPSPLSSHEHCRRRFCHKNDSFNFRYFKFEEKFWSLDYGQK